MARYGKSRFGNKVYYYQDVEFWPEHGIINIVHCTTGKHTQCSVRSFLLERTGALVGERNRADSHADRQQLQDVIDSMVECCQIARKQGDPFGAKAASEMMRGKGRQSILVPGMPTASGADKALKLILPPH